jgi:hypothetical protein
MVSLDLVKVRHRDSPKVDNREEGLMRDKLQRCSLAGSSFCSYWLTLTNMHGLM